jgi:hypothetical protein
MDPFLNEAINPRHFSRSKRKISMCEIKNIEHFNIYSDKANKNDFFFIDIWLQFCIKTPS